MQLYNTRTRQKEIFKPQDTDHVGLYVCGPTVYDYAHIGNARPVVVFDILARLLRQTYPHVTYVRNITDIDDKINAAAIQNKESIAALTERTIGFYHDDMAALGALPPDQEPRATHHIDDMIQMIEGLINKKHAYAEQGHVLFSVSTFRDYGCFSRRNQEELRAGARVEIAPYKRAPEDFVLWKPSDDQTPGWESPWGRGRPGWHIECSAMSSRYLGKTFDIHGGGIDLTFPHHENEIAQSCCYHETPVMAHFWMHNGHVMVNGEKMSKSLGNFLTVHDLLQHCSGEALRFALIATHYRQPLDWSTETTLPQAKQTLNRFYQVLLDAQIQRHEEGDRDALFLEALSDDLNIPLALSHMHDLATRFHKTKDRKLALSLKKSGELLGILQEEPCTWFQTQGGATPSCLSPEEIEHYIVLRQQARKDKNFAESDRIRNLLLEKNIVLEDTPTGTTWRCR